MQVFSPSLSEGATIFKEVLWVSAFHANEVRRGLSAEPLPPELSQFHSQVSGDPRARSGCSLHLPAPLRVPSLSFNPHLLQLAVSGYKIPNRKHHCCVQGKLP